MDYAGLSQVLGGSIFSEEYRGNLKDIESRCANYQGSLGQLNSVWDRRSATLLQAVYLIFVGDLSKAQSYLEGLLEEDNTDGRFAARCRCYLFYLLCMKRLPPVLRFRSTIGDSASLLLDSELQLEERVQADEQARQASSNSLIDTVESILIGNMLTLNTTLHISFVAHPRHLPTVAEGFPIPSNPFAGGILELSAHLSSQTTELYLDRLAVELHLARDSSESQILLERLQDAYIAADDLSGAANCLLIKADGLVCPPFTSPLAMGLIAVVKGEGWSNNTWDAAEGAFPLHDDEGAQDLYNLSRSLFEAADCPRGAAAVLLRRGCIHHAVALSAPTGAAATTALTEADSCFSKSAELFEGDIVNSMLVRCHQLLLAISSRGLDELRDTMALSLDLFDAARSLGRRAYDTGNAGAAQFMGSLMLRLGRWRFIHRRDAQLALVCCACARIFLAAARDSYLELQALVAHASLLHQSGDYARAEIKISEGRGPGGLLERVLERIKRANGASGGTDDVSTLRVLRSNTLGNFDAVAGRIYQAAGNSTSFDEWSKERDRLGPWGNSASSEQEMRILLDRFLKMALGRNPSPEPANQDGVVDRIVQPFVSLTQLVAAYTATMSRVYAALDDADVEAWQRQLWQFLQQCDNAAQQGLPSDQVAVYKLFALSQLGDLEKARTVLPSTLTEDFAGPMGSTSRDVVERLIESYGPPEMVAWRRRKKLEAADLAVSYCILAQDWTRGAAVLSKIVAVLPEFSSPNSVPQTPSSWLTLTFVGMIHERAGRPTDALEWYRCALDQLESLRNGVDIEVRRGCHSSIHSGELFAGLVRTCLAFEGNPTAGPPQQHGLPEPSWRSQALAFLERGRSRALLDLVVIKDNLDPKKIDEWAQLAYEGHLFVSVTAQQGDGDNLLSYNEISARLNRRGIAAVRNKEDVLGALSRLEARQLASGSMIRFSETPLTTELLFASIPVDTVVFEMNSSRQGLIILGVTCQGVVTSHQSGLTDIQLRTLVLRFNHIIRASQGTAEDKDELHRIAAEISDEIVKPFQQIIHAKQVVAFAPSHVMHLFPCSALLLDGKPLFLEKMVYHIPSLSVLHRLSRRHASAATGDGDVVSVLASSAAAGANMRPKEAIGDRKAIPMIGPEAAMIACAFDTNPQDLAGAHPDELRAILGRSDIVHIATHGTALFGSPWQSYLDTTPPFRVLDLAALKRCARLVVFGCCWSGAGTANPGNDIVGFTHATLASGAQAFVGGLWKTSDVASMLLMVLFYREIARSLHGRPVRLAEAWRNAQVALYRSDVASARELLAEARSLWMDKLRCDETRYLERFKYSAGALNAFLVQYSRQGAVLDFKHPAMWAPYILMGCGDVVFGQLPSA